MQMRAAACEAGARSTDRLRNCGSPVNQIRHFPSANAANRNRLAALHLPVRTLGATRSLASACVQAGFARPRLLAEMPGTESKCLATAFDLRADWIRSGATSRRNAWVGTERADIPMHSEDSGAPGRIQSAREARRPSGYTARSGTSSRRDRSDPGSRSSACRARSPRPSGSATTSSSRRRP